MQPQYTVQPSAPAWGLPSFPPKAISTFLNTLLHGNPFGLLQAERELPLQPTLLLEKAARAAMLPARPEKELPLQGILINL